MEFGPTSPIAAIPQNAELMQLIVGGLTAAVVLFAMLKGSQARRELDPSPLPPAAPPEATFVHLQGPLQRIMDDQQRIIALLDRLIESHGSLREFIVKVSREDKHAIVNDVLHPAIAKTDLKLSDIEDLLRALHDENRPVFKAISDTLIRLEERGRRGR